MADIVEIKFKGNRKELYANPMQFPFRVGDYAIVEAEKGIDLGEVNQVSPLLTKKVEDGRSLREILRKATPEDLRRHQENRCREGQALEICKRKVQEHQLIMKLVDCEYQFDGNKMTFYFTAEKRVDFRELVRDLASEFKTRIELRQIGVRDEAKRMGGYGVCGRELCCAVWIKEFQPITTQTAKDQNLTLNPNKLAGVCGRLKCCLMYERDFYNMAIAKFPRLAKPIETERGTGILTRIDVFKEEATVLYEDNCVETLTLEEIRTQVYKCQNNCEPKVEDLQEVARAN
jgi:cell fate regulator YaaT (PSP1 superfamily)